eukprot:c7323_g1_i1.p1 GENE.c7323_g1_i1~~c7323_g1_i1.p1  ORF type:complete len:126 (+),score=23.05 c7323_g1_i1:10-387(+)
MRSGSLLCVLVFLFAGLVSVNGLYTGFSKGCGLTVGQICDSLQHIDTSDDMQVDVACDFVRTRMDPMCQNMCECIAKSHATSCTDSECNEQRQMNLCRLGVGYFSDMCPALVSQQNDLNTFRMLS